MNELKYIESTYNICRFSDIPTLTIAPTLDCNLACRYCYENKNPKRMNEKTIEALKVFFKATLDETRARSINIDWYGGEPLLAYKLIVNLSKTFQKECDERGCEYRSSMSTNGTLLTKKVVEELKTHNISSIQVTLDGTKEVHDRNRPFKNSGGSSYETILKNIDRAIGKVELLIRMNADRDNIVQILDQLDDFHARGWISDSSKFYPYIAPIRILSRNCNILPSKCITTDYFETFKAFVSRLKEYGVRIQGSEFYCYPNPRYYNCGAVSLHSYIVNPDGYLFKCSLTIDDPKEKVGTIFEPICITNPNFTKWLTYNPFTKDTCLSCLSFPSCLGGCPKGSVSNDSSDIFDQRTFLKDNFIKLISLHGCWLGAKPR